jgi:hypothetical protein
MTLGAIILAIIVGFIVLSFIRTPFGQLLTLLAFIGAASVVYPPAAALVGLLIAVGIVYYGTLGGEGDLFIPAVVLVVSAVPVAFNIGVTNPLALVASLGVIGLMGYGYHRIDAR